MKTLLERAQELNKRLAIMEGRQKGENIEIAGKVITLCDFEFLSDEKGEEYAVYIVKELDDLFFFAGMALTEHLKTLNAEGYKDAIKSEGLPIRLTQEKSKKGRTYYAVEFVPKD